LAHQDRRVESDVELQIDPPNTRGHHQARARARGRGDADQQPVYRAVDRDRDRGHQDRREGRSIGAIRVAERVVERQPFARRRRGGGAVASHPYPRDFRRRLVLRSDKLLPRRGFSPLLPSSPSVSGTRTPSEIMAATPSPNRRDVLVESRRRLHRRQQLGRDRAEQQPGREVLERARDQFVDRDMQTDQAEEEH
ncbi:hypothetical protein THAOC_04530, partial [Thalassiosira oceanica]